MAPRKKQNRPARRKPNTGAIRLKKGRALPYESSFPLEHGHRYDYFATRAEAEAHLNRLVAERDSMDAPRNITGGSQRVDTFLIAWLNGKRGHIKEKTWYGYRYLCELANGEIGTYRLDEVTRERASSTLTHLHRQGFKNVSQLRAVLRQAFQYAVDEEYIKRNPFQKAKAPQVERRKAMTLTQAQRSHFLSTIADDPLCALFHLYSRLGLRRGEGLAIRWVDVDLDGGTIAITGQYTEVGSKVVKSTPKTKRSTRTIPLPTDLVALLRRHRVWQLNHIDQAPAWQDYGLVFTTGKGTPISPRNIVRTFKAMLRRANLPITITIHDLRHTAEYLFEQDGAPLSVRMALLGHATAEMAGHYSDHADLDAMRYAVARTA